MLVWVLCLVWIGIASEILVLQHYFPSSSSSRHQAAADNFSFQQPNSASLLPRLHPDFLHIPISHRGLHDGAAGRPENSMAAFQAAIESGYGIEIDLQMSKDGIPMVFHDSDLFRLTGIRGLIGDFRARELQTFSLEKTAAQYIPTLAASLALVKNQVPLLIKIKETITDKSDIATIAKIVQRYFDCGYRVAVMSLHPHIVAHFHQFAPTIPAGLVTGEALDEDLKQALGPRVVQQLRYFCDFDRIGACFIAHNKADLHNPRVAALKQQGIPILCWTITSQKQEEEVCRHGATNIIFEHFLPAGQFNQ